MNKKLTFICILCLIVLFSSQVAKVLANRHHEHERENSHRDNEYSCNENNPTPTLEPTPEPTKIPQEIETPGRNQTQSDAWDCSKDNSCHNEPSAPANDQCPANLKPAANQIYNWIGAGSVKAQWTRSTEFPFAHIQFRCGDAVYSKLLTMNDGIDVVELVPDRSCLFRVAEVSKQGDGACITPWTEWKIDP